MSATIRFATLLFSAAIAVAPVTPALSEPTDNDAASSHVKRAQFTTAVIDREPVDNLEVLTPEYDEIQFFTELRDLAGETVTHQWRFNGEVMAEIDFEVQGVRWRVHSRKQLQPDLLGHWEVVVLDSAGQKLGSGEFDYVEKE